MNILNNKDFMKEYILKNDSMHESELQRVFHFPIDPIDS